MRLFRARSDRGSRRRDAGFFLPLCGLLVLVPPFINLFTRPTLLWGIPLEVVYLFSVWLALVVGAFALSRDVQAESDPADPMPQNDRAAR